jgi:hypothetical protein
LRSRTAPRVIFYHLKFWYGKIQAQAKPTKKFGFSSQANEKISGCQDQPSKKAIPLSNFHLYLQKFPIFCYEKGIKAIPFGSLVKTSQARQIRRA